MNKVDSLITSTKKALGLPCDVLFDHLFLETEYYGMSTMYKDSTPRSFKRLMCDDNGDFQSDFLGINAMHHKESRVYQVFLQELYDMYYLSKNLKNQDLYCFKEKSVKQIMNTIIYSVIRSLCEISYLRRPNLELYRERGGKVKKIRWIAGIIKGVP